MIFIFVLLGQASNRPDELCDAVIILEFRSNAYVEVFELKQSVFQSVRDSMCLKVYEVVLEVRHYGSNCCNKQSDGK